MKRLNSHPRLPLTSLTIARRNFLPRGRLVIRKTSDFYSVVNEVITAALLYIAERSQQPIRIGDAARAVNMEPRTLCRRFAKVYGRTPRRRN